MPKNKHEDNCQALPFGEYDGQKFIVDGKHVQTHNTHNRKFIPT